jgi:hypothetical protein
MEKALRCFLVGRHSPATHDAKLRRRVRHHRPAHVLTSQGLLVAKESSCNRFGTVQSSQAVMLGLPHLQRQRPAGLATSAGARVYLYV